MTGHLTDDALVALALGDAEPSERAASTAHLDECAACRGALRGIEDAMGHTLAASPAIAPPRGFAGRVAAAIAAESASSAESADSHADDRTGYGVPTWVPWLAAAASLLVGAGLGVSVTLGVLGAGATRPAPSPGVSAVPSAGAEPGIAPSPGGSTGLPAASTLVTRNGDAVGTAGTTTVDGRRLLVLTVTTGRPGMTYECVLVGPDGIRTSGGTWTLGESYGSGVASGTWVVPIADAEVSRVELVAPSGAVWSSATF